MTVPTDRPTDRALNQKMLINPGITILQYFSTDNLETTLFHLATPSPDSGSTMLVKAGEWRRQVLERFWSNFGGSLKLMRWNSYSTCLFYMRATAVKSDRFNPLFKQFFFCAFPPLFLIIFGARNVEWRRTWDGSFRNDNDKGAAHQSPSQDVVDPFFQLN